MKKAMRLKQVFSFISYQLRTTDEAPTIAEICQRFDITVGYAHELLKRLEDNQLITRIPNVTRGIALVADVQPATQSAISVDGFEPVDEDELEQDVFVDVASFPATQNAYMDPETIRALNAYLKDWHERMATWRGLQRQWMPDRRFSTHA